MDILQHRLIEHCVCKLTHMKLSEVVTDRWCSVGSCEMKVCIVVLLCAASPESVPRLLAVGGCGYYQGNGVDH